MAIMDLFFPPKPVARPTPIAPVAKPATTGKSAKR
jgi:hypothetical protein